MIDESGESTPTERRRAAQYAVARVLAEAATLAEAAPAILQSVCEHLEWAVGVLWEAEHDGGPLRCVEVWQAAGTDASEFASVCRQRSFAPGAGLPGRVLSTREPVWVPNVLLEPNFPRAFVAASAGLHSALAAPILLGDEALGVVEFFSPEIERPSADLLGMMVTMGSQIGQFIGRVRAQEALQRREEYFRSLIENASDLITILNLDGTIRYESPSLERILGYRPEELVGTNAFELIHPEDLPATLATFSYGVQVPDYSTVVQFRYRHKDGSWRILEATGKNLLDDPVVAGIVINSRDVTRRKEAEARLQASEAELRALFAAITDLIVVLDAEGRYLEVATTTSAAGQGQAHELIGKTVGEIFPPSQAAALLDAIRAALDSQAPVRIEYSLPASESEVWFETTISPLFDRRVICVARDVTGRKEAEEERARLLAREQAARSEAEAAAERVRRLQAVTETALAHAALDELLQELPGRVREIMDTDTVVILLVSEDGQELVVRAAQGLDEVPPNGLSVPVGRGVAGRIASGREALIVDDLAAADVASPALRRKSGLQSLVGAPLVVEGRLVGVIQAATRRRRQFTPDDARLLQHVADRIALAVDRAYLYEAERQARAEAEMARQRLAFLLEAGTQLAGSLHYETTLASLARLAVPHLGDYTFVDVVEEDGTIRRVAAAHARAAKEALVQELLRFPPDPKRNVGVAKVLRTGEPEMVAAISTELLAAYAVSPEHHAVLRKLGPRSSMMVPLRAHERTLGVVTFVRTQSGRGYTTQDLALAEELARRAALAVDNARLYREAQEAIRAREEFLSIASHELRTPLTALQGYTALLQRRAAREGTADSREIQGLRVVYEQSVRLGKLIELLMDYSRLQTGQLQIARRPVDLVSLARRLMEEAGPTLEQHHLQLTTPHEALVIKGDELRLEQVLRNLLDNAVKYSPQGGTITVGVEAHGARAALWVADEGLGIPEEALARIFSRFFRAGNVARRVSGAGIGLYVVKELVTLHGGTVEVESREGEGSRFTVWLPLGAGERSAGLGS